MFSIVNQYDKLLMTDIMLCIITSFRSIQSVNCTINAFIYPAGCECCGLRLSFVVLTGRYQGSYHSGSHVHWCTKERLPMSQEVEMLQAGDLVNSV